MQNSVILVDDNDRQIGVMDKLAAHVEGRLHRAFSIFVFDRRGNLLLQQRAADKYHSGGLWSNTCCSHPYPGESTIDAAHRRLVEEMGFDCRLSAQPAIIYRAELDCGLTEHEFDHIFFGEYEGPLNVNEAEVKAWQWVSLTRLVQCIASQPETFTTWMKLIVSAGRLAPRVT